MDEVIEPSQLLSESVSMREGEREKERRERKRGKREKEMFSFPLFPLTPNAYRHLEPDICICGC